MIENILSHYPEQFRKITVSKSVVEEAKARVLDSLGCFFGAYNEKPVRLLRQTLTNGVRGPVSLWGTKRGVSAEMAAWVNGSAIRALDYNDTYLSKEPCHPSDLMASLWAACELTPSGQEGHTLIKGLILGYEVLCRLCDATSLRKKGWDHVTYLPIASAVGCSYVFNLNPDQTRQALSLALVGHNAMRQTRVGMISDWKAACAAYAAQAGLWAARLAKHGFTGPNSIFSGQHGFFQQVSGSFTLSKDPLLKIEMILKTHVKRFPAEHHAQSAIEACLALRNRISIKDIKTVIVETFDAGLDIIGKEKEKWEPQTRETADHSLPYLVAVSLLDGDVTLKQYEKKRFLDKDVRGLMKKIKVKRAAGLNQLYPRNLPVRVLVFTKQGHGDREEVLRPKGYAGHPLSRLDLETKFKNLASRCLASNQINAVLEKINQIEKITHLNTLSNWLVAQ